MSQNQTPQNTEYRGHYYKVNSDTLWRTTVLQPQSNTSVAVLLMINCPLSYHHHFKVLPTANITNTMFNRK